MDPLKVQLRATDPRLFGPREPRARAQSTASSALQRHAKKPARGKVPNGDLAWPRDLANFTGLKLKIRTRQGIPSAVQHRGACYCVKKKLRITRGICVFFIGSRLVLKCPSMYVERVNGKVYITISTGKASRWPPRWRRW